MINRVIYSKQQRTIETEIGMATTATILNDSNKIKKVKQRQHTLLEGPSAAPPAVVEVVVVLTSCRLSWFKMSSLSFTLSSSKASVKSSRNSAVTASYCDLFGSVLGTGSAPSLPACTSQKSLETNSF